MGVYGALLGRESTRQQRRGGAREDLDDVAVGQIADNHRDCCQRLRVAVRRGAFSAGRSTWVYAAVGLRRAYGDIMA